MASVDKQWRLYSKSLEDDFAFAASVALSDAAFRGRAVWGSTCTTIFNDGAPPLTTKAFRVSKYAKKTDLESEVLFYDIQIQYLVPAILCGVRRAGDYATARSGVLIPGEDAWNNKYGNFPRRYLKNWMGPSEVVHQLG